MTATHGVGTYGNAVGTVTPLDHKMAQLGLIAKTAANTIRPGLFWDGSATIVSGKANMSYDVRAFTAVLSRGATAGAVLLSNDAVYNVTTTAAPGSNSRYDVVYVWQREYSIDGTDSDPVIGVVQGTAAASPTVPSLSAYPGAIELARILVPSGVTATNSGTTITQTAPFTATAGGVIAFRNTTERDAGTYQESQLGWLIDTDTYQVYTGAAWKTVIVDTPGETLVSTGTFSAVSAVNISSLMTATYRRYRLRARWVQSASASTRLRLRDVSTDHTTGYDFQNHQGAASVSSAARQSNQTSWELCGILGANTEIEIDLILSYPMQATSRTFYEVSTTGVDGNDPFRIGYSGAHRTSDDYDGLSIFPSSGTITGEWSLYRVNR